MSTMDNETARMVGKMILIGALFVWLAPAWITVILGI